MAVVVTSDLLSTVARMGLATLRESIQLVRRTNREYERDITAASPNSTVNVVVPAPITAVAVTPGGVHPNDTAAVTPTVVPVTLDQWYRAPFAFSDKQMVQVDKGIVPMQIAEAIRGLVNKIETNVWLNYKKIYGYAGAAGTIPFATGEDEFLAAEKVANDQLMPGDRRALLLNTAAYANWRALRRVYDRNFADIGVEPAWTQHVPLHTQAAATAGTIALDDSASRPVGTKTLHMDGFSVKPEAGDLFTIAGDTQTYTVVSSTTLAGTDSDVTFEPGLKVAIPAVDGSEVVTFKGSHRVNLLVHPNCIAFAMAPMMAGASLPGAGATEATVVDNVSGLALRVTFFRQFYQDEWSFDALWGSNVPRPELGVRIAGEAV